MKNYLMRKGNGNDVGFFQDAFDELFRPVFSDGDFDSMKTDIKEKEDGYEMNIDMPGFDKKEINLSLEDGYVNVVAKKEEKEEDKNNRFIKRERSVSCSRSYYVGDVDESDVKAKYDNGVLSLFIPKEKAVENPSHSIMID